MCCSKCGLDCGKCSLKEEYGCSGCLEMTDGYWGEKCEIKACCEEKGLEHCGLCGDFPCEMLLDYSYDPETGDDGERLLNCKKWADEKSSAHDSRIKNILFGVVLGGISGLLIGEWQGMVVPFILGGAVAGTGIALMIETAKK